MSTKKNIILLSFTFLVLSYIILKWSYQEQKEIPHIIQNTTKSDLIQTQAQKSKILPEGFIDYISSFQFYPFSLQLKKDETSHTYFQISIENNHVVLENDQSKKNMFVMTPNLAFPIQFKHCVSFASLEKEDYFLSIKENKVVLLPYQGNHDYKLSSSFCLYPEDDFFAQTNHGFFVSSFDGKYDLTHHVTNELFMDRSLYLKNSSKEADDKKKLLKLVKTNQQLLPQLFSVKSFDGTTSYYKLNRDKNYVLRKDLLPDAVYFQKARIQIQHLDLKNSTSNLNEHIYHNNVLNIQRNNLYATTKQTNVTDMSFVIIPSLAMHKNKDCISIASFNLRNYFLVDENKVLQLKRNDYTELFFQQASFCLETYQQTLFRLESMFSPNFFINHHSLSDQSLYFMENNPSDTIKTTLSFNINQIDFGPRDYTIVIDNKGTLASYHYDYQRKQFVRQKKTSDKMVLTKKMDYHFDSALLKKLSCDLLSRKYKIYYHANQVTTDGSLKFQIDPENSHLIDQLECFIPQTNTDRIKIVCNPNIEPIHLEKDCTLHITKEHKTTLLLPNQWLLKDYFSKQEVDTIVQDDTLQLIYIRFKSSHHKISKKIDYCSLQTGDNEFRYTDSLVQDKKMFLSFQVPKSALQHLATFQCQLEPDNDRLEGYFQCQITINKQSEIIAEDCRA